MALDIAQCQDERQKLEWSFRYLDQPVTSFFLFQVVFVGLEWLHNSQISNCKSRTKILFHLLLENLQDVWRGRQWVHQPAGDDQHNRHHGRAGGRWKGARWQNCEIIFFNVDASVQSDVMSNSLKIGIPLCLTHRLTSPFVAVTTPSTFFNRTGVYNCPCHSLRTKVTLVEENWMMRL